MSSDKASGEDGEQGMNNKKAKKTLNVKAESAKFIELKAEEWYGSSYEQGRVVDKLIREYQEQEDVSEEIRKLREDVKSLASPSSGAVFSDTHRGKSDEGRDREASMLEEVVELADDGEPIDADEYDLSVVKGVRGVDRSQVLFHALASSDQTGWTTKQMKEFVVDEMDYSTNKAREIVNKTVRKHMMVSPLNGLDEWLPSQVDEEIANKYAQADPDTPSDKAYRREYTKSVEDYAGLSGDIPTDVYYCTDEKLARSMLLAVIQSCKSVRGPSSTYERKRAVNLTAEVLRRIPMDAYDTTFEYYSEEQTLKDHIEVYIDENEEVPDAMADIIVQF